MTPAPAASGGMMRQSREPLAPCKFLMARHLRRMGFRDIMARRARWPRRSHGGLQVLENRIFAAPAVFSADEAEPH
jgi:hypothetical protein